VRLPARQRTAGGRSRRRPGARLGVLRVINRWRVAGFLLAAAAAIWGTFVVSSHAFDLDPAKTHVSELVYTSPELIRDVMDLAPDASPNVFRIDTRTMERALASLPAVAEADVSVLLPDTLDVQITERTPTFVVATTAATFVVDVDGFVLDEVPLSDATTLGLPVVTDIRQLFAPGINAGSRLDGISLDAALRLLALTPEDLGTRFGTLALTVDDVDGYVLTARPDGWRAIFGHYTPNLRPVDLIDRQVQCLRSRIGAGEDGVNVIYLAPQGEHCGTYVPGRTPGTPGRTAAPTPRS
jgi:cell division septal protein FtsQ